MSQIKDSFDANELSELAEEIRKDLLTEPSVTNNNSFVFKIEEINPTDKKAVSNPRPSWSYLSLSYSDNDDIYNNLISPSHGVQITPYSPQQITPLSLNQNSSCNLSFPDLPPKLTKLSTNISINAQWNGMNTSKKYSFNTPTPLDQPRLQFQLTDISVSSINSDSLVSPRTRSKQRKVSLPIPDYSSKHNKCPSKNILSPVIMNSPKTFHQFQSENKKEFSTSSMEVNVEYSEKEYAIEFEDGFIFFNADNSDNDL